MCYICIYSTNSYKLLTKQMWQEMHFRFVMNYIGWVKYFVISYQLLIMAVRVQSKPSLCGICGKRSGTGAGFLPFSLPIPILLNTPFCWLSSGAGALDSPMRLKSQYILVLLLTDGPHILYVCMLTMTIISSHSMCDYRWGFWIGE